MPSFLRGCDNISVEYELALLINGKERLVTPIIVGTIPFVGDQVRSRLKTIKTMRIYVVGRTKGFVVV